MSTPVKRSNVPWAIGTRHVRAGVVGAIAVALLAACGSGDEAVAPEGFVLKTVGALSVAVPQDWQDIEGTTEKWQNGWADAELDSAQYLLIASPEFGSDGADLGRSTFVAGAQIGGVPGYASESFTEPVATDSLEIARNDYTYTSADGAAYEGIFWAAADPESGVTVALQLTGKDLPADLVAGIESSIRVDASAT
ncbi:ATP-grasp domain-containing protein [Pengzhenrongella sicca]|uniref:Uncharacterized protein n=1 Tax=Pengzhenrongella sicca TaxID=2819238 RepID=A0A8A4ZDG8_9MICO|nr:hypothetical protein [Pengzhenrongella sicca]QTE29964.1 hypothetical protein J4E96_02755 [Pengzhenrongella sicca]